MKHLNKICPVLLLVLLPVVQVLAARIGMHVYPEPLSAPVLQLTDQDGRDHRLEDYRDHIVIVNFWASWCAPCKKEMPSLQATKRAFSDTGLVVLAVSLDDSWQATAQGMKGYESDFVALLDQDGETAGRWGALGVPTAFVLDRQGKIRLRIVGGYDWEDPELRRHIELLL
jgi:peroxiredoxin